MGGNIPDWLAKMLGPAGITQSLNAFVNGVKAEKLILDNASYKDKGDNKAFFTEMESKL